MELRAPLPKRFALCFLETEAGFVFLTFSRQNPLPLARLRPRRGRRADVGF